MTQNAYESHRDMMRQSVAWTTEHGACLSHFHSSIELLYMLEGSMMVILDGAEMVVHQHECLLCSSYMIHSYQDNGDHKSIVAIIPLNTVPMISKALGSSMFDHAVLQDKDGRICTMLKLLLDATEHDNLPMLKGMSYALLGYLMERSPLRPAQGNAQSELIRDILQYIHEHIEQPLSVKDVADAFGYSESRFSHLFQERLKRTMHDYIRQLRCQQAAQLLRETELPVTDIAMSKGFESIQTFYRSFKRCYGVTPAVYRSMNTISSPYAESKMTELFHMEQHPLHRE